MNYTQFNKSLEKWQNPDQEGGKRISKDFKSSEANRPKITIITTVLNSEKYLEECFKSLHDQNFNHYEHIVVDGGYTIV